MEHYKRLKNLFDVMEEGHLLLEPVALEQGGYKYTVREYNDAFLSIFDLHKDIVVDKQLSDIGVLNVENYWKLAALLEDVHATQKPGKRDLYFSQSLVDATVIASSCGQFIDLLIYNWSKRDVINVTRELSDLIKIFVSRQLCYIELDEQLKVTRLIGDVEKALHLKRKQLTECDDYFKTLIYFKDYDMFYQSVGQIKERESNSIVFRILGNHGKKVWLRLDLIKVGQRISAIIENIDCNKRIEDAYLKKNSTLRRVQKLTQTGDWEWDALKGKYYVSEGLMNLLDIAPKEVNQLETFYKNRLSNLSSEMNQSMMGHEHIYEFLKSDGSRVWLADKHQKKYDAYGNLLSIFGITQEITKDKELYDQIVQLNAEYKSIYHSVKAAILVVDVMENGHFAYSNMNTEALELFDLEESDILGQSPELVMGHLGQQLLYHYTNCVKNKESIRVLERLNRYGQDVRIICLLSPTIEGDRVVKIIVSALENF